MRDIDNLCINCWGELTEGNVCANCGYDNDTQNDMKYLPAKTIINDKYVIGSIDRIESDSVTYNGYDTQLDKRIYIRELNPNGIANRLEGSKDIHIRQKYVDEYSKFKKSFIKLWTTLEKMQNFSAVVPVYDVFEENETAYAIIERIESIPLREYLLRNEKGYINWDSARIMFMPVLTTIETLHSYGIIHGSISPDNLVLCRDGKVRLKAFTIQEACESKSVLEFNYTDGYTALEQYDNNHKVCPATDIYAFGACIYRALVGTNPPDAISREANDKLMIPNEIAESIPIHTIKALSSGLQIYPEKRTKTIVDFRDMLDATPSVQAKAAEPVRKVDVKDAENVAYHDVTTYKEPKNTKSIVAIVILVILIIGAIVAGVWVIKNNPSQSNEPTAVPSSEVTYQVPNFSNNGYSQSDIENNAAWNDQFNITFNYQYSTSVEEGIIFEQSVKAGETIPAKSGIVLTVSKGVQTETVPDVSGLTIEQATQQLEKLGFKVSSVEVYNDGSHTKGQVRASYPSAPEVGAKVALGEEIILQVYGEAQPPANAD